MALTLGARQESNQKMIREKYTENDITYHPTHPRRYITEGMGRDTFESQACFIVRNSIAMLGLRRSARI